MASNPNLNLPVQEFSSTGSSSSFDNGMGMIAGKPIVKASRPLSPMIVRLAAAVAALRASKDHAQTKPSSKFTP